MSASMRAAAAARAAHERQPAASTYPRGRQYGLGLEARLLAVRLLRCCCAAAAASAGFERARDGNPPLLPPAPGSGGSFVASILEQQRREGAIAQQQ